MSPEDLSARNRQNAQKSTGPKTSTGKAAVAQNARRHGATAKPDPASVAAWLRVILDDPDLTPVDFLAQDDRLQRALALAEAEVRVGRAATALAAFEAGTTETRDFSCNLLEFVDHVFGERAEEMTQKDMREAARVFARLQRTQHDETQPGGSAHRLRQRYLREARAHRRRAFRAWLACLREEPEGVRAAA